MLWEGRGEGGDDDSELGEQRGGERGLVGRRDKEWKSVSVVCTLWTTCQYWKRIWQRVLNETNRKSCWQKLVFLCTTSICLPAVCLSGCLPQLNLTNGVQLFQQVGCNTITQEIRCKSWVSLGHFTFCKAFKPNFQLYSYSAVFAITFNQLCCSMFEVDQIILLQYEFIK